MKWHLAHNCARWAGTVVQPSSDLFEEFAFQSVLEGHYPGDCARIGKGVPENTFGKFLAALELTQELQNKLIMELRLNGKVRLDTKNYGHIRLQCL